MVEREVLAVDPQRQQRALVGDLPAGERRRAERADFCSDSVSSSRVARRRRRARRDRAAARRSSPGSSTSPRRRRSAASTCAAASPAAASRLSSSLFAPSSFRRQVAADLASADYRRRRRVRLIWNPLGPLAGVAAARRRNAERRNGPPIDCARCHHGETERAGADHAEQAAPRDRRRRGASSGVVESSRGGSGSVWARSSRSGAITPRSRKARSATGTLVTRCRPSAARKMNAP